MAPADQRLEGGEAVGVHEWERRLLENLVGLSRAFWKYFFPLMQAACTAQLSSVPVAAFYSEINGVQQCVIRVV